VLFTNNSDLVLMDYCFDHLFARVFAKDWRKVFDMMFSKLFFISTLDWVKRNFFYVNGRLDLLFGSFKVFAYQKVTL
jgi:hypothetical protein